MPMADGSEYPFRSFFPGAPEQHSLAFQLPAGEALVVLNQFPALNAMDQLSVSANGRAVKPLWQDRSTRLYRCATCADAVDWQIRFRAADATQVYVLALNPH